MSQLPTKPLSAQENTQIQQNPSYGYVSGGNHSRMSNDNLRSYLSPMNALNAPQRPQQMTTAISSFPSQQEANVHPLQQVSHVSPNGQQQQLQLQQLLALQQTAALAGVYQPLLNMVTPQIPTTSTTTSSNQVPIQQNQGSFGGGLPPQQQVIDPNALLSAAMMNPITNPLLYQPVA